MYFSQYAKVRLDEKYFPSAFRLLFVLLSAIMLVDGEDKYYLDDDTSAMEVCSFNGIQMDIYPRLSQSFDGYEIQNHTKACRIL